ncbi:MAG TPA: hypothetical protein VFH38_05635 [Jatrophihabitans sp.]|nr:hypothetical protein [Jatrophihabitans sp.]
MHVRPLLPACALIGAAALAALGTAAPTSARPPTPGRPAAAAASVPRAPAAAAVRPGRLRFSRMVIVDEQRPGNEPDVKVDSRGRIYSSEPFGFSTTSSFLWRSNDHGRSYQLVPGNIGSGKPTTCAGGGDTDLFIDRHDALYFSDLQGLTNISNSVSTDGGKTWQTTCAGAPNTPVDRMWFTGTGSLAKGNLRLYQDYDQVNTSASPNNPGGNQLVETLSTDGVTFVPVTNPNLAGTDCLGTAVNCVTDNEGISGNQVIDPKTGNVFIAHTAINGASSGTPGVQVSEGRIADNGGAPTATWTASRNLDAALCPHTRGTCVDKAGNPTELAGENFASIARDGAGYLYVTFTAGSLHHAHPNAARFGQLTGPEQIYVVHSLEPATMTDPAKVTWSRPQRITGAHRGISTGTNTFPWITAGSRGRVAVAWYHTATSFQKGACGKPRCRSYGAAALKHAEWTVQVAQTLHGAAAAPRWRRATVSDGPIKYGAICTNGLGCATGGDRSLGDFLQVSPDRQGALLVTYVDDTSGNVQGGEDAGPEVISRQIGGPSLYAGHRVTVDGGPARQSGGVRDQAGDAAYSADGSRTSADKAGYPQLDLTAASIHQPRHRGYLLARIRVRRLVKLTGSPALGGTDVSWMLRWTEVRRGRPGNGLIYYAGVDNQGATPGSAPSFFMGTTDCVPPANQQEHCKFFTYPQTRQIKGAIARKHGVITLRIPRKYLHLRHGGKLRSVTGFTTTAATPQSSATLFNLIDATTPFDVRVR